MAVPDIFDEVAEDLRAERARAMLRRYGGLLVALAVLVVIGAGGWELWRAHQASEDAKQATIFLAAQKRAAGALPGRADALPALESLAQTGGAGYRTLARLRAAGIKADAGDLAGATSLWNDVSADNAADALLRDLASLQWASHQIDTGAPGEITLRLAPLMAPGNPFRPLAEEVTALLALRQGQTDTARDIFKRLATDNGAPDGLRGRANGLLQRLGAGT
jgi:hypothetical protein